MHIVLVPCGSCTEYYQLCQKCLDLNPNFEVWLLSRAPPSTAEVSHRTGQGNEAAPALSWDTGKEINQDVAAGTFLPGFLYPGTKHRGHVALRECHHLLLKVNQVVMSNPLQRSMLSGLHLNARNMKNTSKNQWVHVRPVSGSSIPDPSQSEAKASMWHELIKWLTTLPQLQG